MLSSPNLSRKQRACRQACPKLDSKKKKKNFTWVQLLSLEQGKDLKPLTEMKFVIRLSVFIRQQLLARNADRYDLIHMAGTQTG
jgi:hypothetical protein